MFYVKCKNVFLIFWQVSCMECGLLPISQEALIVGDVSYHSYQGVLVDMKEKKSTQKHLGPNNKVVCLLLSNVV